MIGMTLLLLNVGSRLWSALLVVGGVVYGVVGVFVLGVMLDWVLLFASLLLIAFMASSAPMLAAVPSFDTGRRTA